MRALWVAVGLVELWLWLTSTAHAQFVPKDNILLACGAAGSTNVSGRTFVADSSFAQGGAPRSGSIPTSSAANLSSADEQRLYSTARVFTAKGSFSIGDLTPGRHWIRLHFLPFSPDLAAALFSVSADEYLLLSSQSVAGEIQAQARSISSPALLKEYSINITTAQLTISLVPSPGSLAFVNAIEIVSIPDAAIQDDGQLVGQGTQAFLGMARAALQTMYRLNVGGESIDPSLDSGLSRRWIRDNPFLVGAREGIPAPKIEDITYPPLLPGFIAPKSVYGTARTMGVSDLINTQFNLTWTFAVDSGYSYFVRMHFCETVYSTPYARIFDVFINRLPAVKGLDVVVKANGAQTAMFMDFVVPMNDGGSSMVVELGPSPGNGAQHNDSILSGIEIFKVNNTRGSLAGSLIPPGVDLSKDDGSSGGSTGIGAAGIGGAVAGGLLVIGLLGAGLCFVRRRRHPGLAKGKSKKKKSASWLPLHAAGNGNSTSIASKFSTGGASNKSGATVASTATSSLGGRFFTFAEILEATNNFDETLLLGVGGFGKVYRGELFDGTKVAVKRGNPRSEQGLTEFQTEIEMLSKLRHLHLVSLIGYCEEHCEMILVYECMANGTLRAHLYGSDLPPLSWKQRLEICIGAARGLHYLHTGAEQGTIIHRDVKTTNILLDENFVAKVSDFGLSKTGPSLDRTHVSTAVKGSFGYLDPEYFRRQQLTEKSDVYSFGVVLFEVLCARPAINPALPREQVNIAEWAMQYQRMGALEQIVDANLKGQCSQESLQKFGETAEKCLAEQGIDRPAMGDVLWNLEYALQLQEASSGDSSGMILDHSATRAGDQMEVPLRSSADHQADYHRRLGSEDDFEDASASAVFSQLVNPQGR
ncbi:hypothetical protein SELMODRAFT_135346 [Selaginella moellendorffii]|uniref:Protein kinase domain-containing protein n=2 Tax=Selaginella moellendorffii TaxID=88036 RepID=D8TA35_SELML|nr:hypothetical protein SELMODRAFT_135346 [Selaginella moellendorffii]